MSTNTPIPSRARYPAVLLAGGRATRMGGGDKCLRRLGGRPILDHVIRTLRPQVSALALNANGDPTRFHHVGLPVIPDEVAGQPGPLAGILAGMNWAAAQMPGTEFVLSVSTDCPFLPKNLVAQLAAALKSDTEIAIAASNGRTHPVIGLWRVRLRKDLHHALALENVRKVEAYCDRHRTVAVNFPGAVNFPAGAVDPFFNANTPDDLALAERLWASAGLP
jgi:molybdenum cofactor guanylyltransferase